MDSQREWWRRALAVFVRPRAVFASLRSVDQADLEARQEPVLAIILLAGIGGILITPAWDSIMDNYERDALVTAVITFIGGGLYGAALYWIAGTALALVLRGLLVLGVHLVERFSWPRVAASIALVGLFLAAFSVVANGVL